METKTISKIQRALFVILALFLIWLLFAPKSSYGQSNCDPVKMFVGGFSIEANKKFPTVTSAYLGISGIYGKGTILDNFTATIGVRFDDAQSGYKVKPEETIVVMPVLTTMYRMRMKGPDSKVIHALAVGTSMNRHKYTQVDWRIYGAPTSRSFATVGGLIGWNTVVGPTIGFVVIGFF